jgi:hypothetical protein
MNKRKGNQQRLWQSIAGFQLVEDDPAIGRWEKKGKNPGVCLWDHLLSEDGRKNIKIRGRQQGNTE